MSNKPMSNKMWGGRFGDSPDQIMEEISTSIDFDRRLYTQDIRGSKAHCHMLAQQGIIPKKDADHILAGLEQIENEIRSGPSFFRRELEDIHMNIEARLHEIVGPAAGRLHTGRSRNDQVATDFKLYIRDTLRYLDTRLKTLQEALVERALQHAGTVMPGCTHLQTAQPVTFGHHCLAYVEMIARDRGRFQDAWARAGECPLGAGALAGTSFPVDREMTAQALGFTGPTRNSLDSVSDRDFVLETLAGAAITATHLSRLAEELVLWVTPAFDFVRLPDSLTTGSSIMPQKKNPDAAELVRAKSGRIIGALTALLVVMKGLPLAYSRDMQEDKEQTFDALDNLSLCIPAMTAMIRQLEIREESMARAAAQGFSTATDLADWLVRTLGLPFREAHHITGILVSKAEEHNCDLHELSLETMREAEPGIDETVYEVLGVANSVHSRNSFGGTAPDNVRTAAQEWQKRLARESGNEPESRP